MRRISKRGRVDLAPALLAMAFFSAFFTPAYADVIYYTSGETLKGLVVEEHRDRIVVNVEGRERPIFRAQIDQVFYDDPERNYLTLGDQAIQDEDFALAQGFLRKALQINPRLQEADDALHRIEDLQRKRDTSERLADPFGTLEERWGLSLEAVAGEPFPIVRWVRPASLAARSGISPADRGVSLWAESLAYLPIEEVAKILLGPPGSLVKLTIARTVALPKASKGGPSWPGMSWGIRRLGLTVETVEPGGQAISSGLRPQDRVVALQGRPTRYMTLSEANRILGEARGGELVLVVQRDIILHRE